MYLLSEKEKYFVSVLLYYYIYVFFPFLGTLQILLMVASLSDEYVICLGCKSPDTILSKENRLFFLRCEKVTSLLSFFRCASRRLALPILDQTLLDFTVNTTSNILAV